MTDTLTRDQIRDLVSCPQCGAAKGMRCNQDGLRAKRLGVNHHSRMRAAQALRLGGQRPDPGLIDDGDGGTA